MFWNPGLLFLFGPFGGRSGFRIGTGLMERGVSRALFAPRNFRHLLLLFYGVPIISLMYLTGAVGAFLRRGPGPTPRPT